MAKIVGKEILNENVTLMEVEAPMIAKKALAGQFIILRVDEKGERIPLTVASTNIEQGLVTIIFQIVGFTTKKLNLLEVGDDILDFVGPLGKPTNIKDVKKACVVAGGVGTAICYPLAQALHKQGTEVDIIIGFRNRDLIILEKEFRSLSKNTYFITDDGSYERKGLVTDVLRELLESGVRYDEVFAVGPLPMMKFVSLLTKQYNQKTTVSMNPIMMDGTGMCGMCRLTVNGETKFACVDGPDFDGFSIDYDEAIARSKMYQKEEREANCRLVNRHE
ncbi:MAG: sulfide/dihydroorotate dehydrogenase-like FAD/NAD-binding protein [Bacilli bacterium]